MRIAAATLPARWQGVCRSSDRTVVVVRPTPGCGGACHRQVATAGEIPSRMEYGEHPTGMDGPQSRGEETPLWSGHHSTGHVSGLLLPSYAQRRLVRLHTPTGIPWLEAIRYTPHIKGARSWSVESTTAVGSIPTAPDKRGPLSSVGGSRDRLPDQRRRVEGSRLGQRRERKHHHHENTAGRLLGGRRSYPPHREGRRLGRVEGRFAPETAALPSYLRVSISFAAANMACMLSLLQL